MPPFYSRTGSRARFSALSVEELEGRCLLDGASFMTEPIIPVINAGMKQHLREIYARGLQLGNRPNVLAKVGDSITWEPNFLNDLGSFLYSPADPVVVGSHSNLAPTLNYFRSQPLPGTINSLQLFSTISPLLAQNNGVNSFNRWSAASFAGWSSFSELAPGLGLPLATELNTIHPAIALIMLGTNDVNFEINNGVSPEDFRVHLTAVTEYTLSQGVIPVLSTIPDVLPFGQAVEARALALNQIIADVASQLDAPLWNYWRALQPLPNRGISIDGIHPSSFPLGTANFTDVGLLYGFNMRNLTAVETLDKLKRVVIDNGPPDFTDLPLTPPTIQYVTSVYDSLLGHTPDPAGLHYWGELVENGLPRQVVAQGIWQSAEHRAIEVRGYYSRYLHRAGAADEVGAWVNVFAAGATEEQVQSGFLTAPEYVARNGGDFVTGLYAGVLGRAPDAAGAASWQRALQAGTSRIELAVSFLESLESERLEINDDYLTLLGRAADRPGADGWLNFLQARGLSAEVAGEAILSSDEYFSVAH